MTIPAEAVPLRRYRIMAFDGGPFAGAAVRMLRKLADHEPRLLQRADLFAGTSFGSFIALWLASRTEEELADGPGTLDKLIPLTDEFYEQYSLPRVGRGALKALAGAALGARPLGGVDRLTDFLTRPDVLGDRKLGDLHRHVACVSFDLRAGHYAKDPFAYSPEDPYPRTWGARVFHNLAPDPEDEDWETGDFERFNWGSWSDRELSLAEVMRRSGALPVWLPIQSGFVDGAVFANNPSMAAVAQALSFRRWLNGRKARNGYGTIGLEDVRNVVVFSLGGEDSMFMPPRQNLELHETAQPGRPLRDRLTRWGWLQWVARPDAPLLAVELLLNADGRGVAFQAQQILTHGFYFRLTACGLESTGKTLLQATFKPSLVSGKAEEVVNAWAQPYREGETRPGESPLSREFLARAAAQAMRAIGHVADLVRVPPPGEPQELTEARRAFYSQLRAFDALARRVTEGRGTVNDLIDEVLPDLVATFLRMPGASAIRQEAVDVVQYIAHQEKLRPDERKASASLPFARAWLAAVWMAVDQEDLSRAAQDLLPHAPVHLWEMLADPFYRQHLVHRLASFVGMPDAAALAEAGQQT